MFDKKYKKTLKVLDDEINFYDKMFKKTIALSKYDEQMLEKSEEYLEKRIALSDFRRKLIKTIGDLQQDLLVFFREDNISFYGIIPKILRGG